MPRKDKGDESKAETTSQEQGQAATDKANTNLVDAKPNGIDRTKVSDKALAMAKELGVPLDPIFDWAEGVDARFKAMEKNMPQVVGKAMDVALAKVANRARERQSQIVNQGGNPQGGQGQGGLGILGELLKGSGGSEPDAEMKLMQKEMFRASIDNMKSGAASQKAIADAVVRRLVSKEVGKALDQI